jgi:nitrate/nitrite-specific signal transduction histidine kinase
MKTNPGLGLMTMQERIHMVQARFNVESRLGQGTKIVASVRLIGSEPQQKPESIWAANVPGAA